MRWLTRIVARCASRSVVSLLGPYRAMGYRPRRIAIVVGSTVDPALITNQHIRAHAHEGRLFRTVVQAAETRHRIGATVMLERELYRVAAHRFGRSPQHIQRFATALGRTVGQPWRTEHKTAAVGAWLLSCTGPPLIGRGKACACTRRRSLPGDRRISAADPKGDVINVMSHQK